MSEAPVAIKTAISQFKDIKASYEPTRVLRGWFVGDPLGKRPTDRLMTNADLGIPTSKQLAVLNEEERHLNYMQQAGATEGFMKFQLQEWKHRVLPHAVRILTD